MLAAVALLAGAGVSGLAGPGAAEAERRADTGAWPASDQGQRPTALRSSHSAGRSGGESSSATAGSSRWGRVLGRLDRVRGRAFASGEVAALGAVYQAGSAVLHRDRAVLRGYVARGLTVHGVGFDLLDVRIRRAAPGVVVLRVVDRLRLATARSGGGARLPLPRDGPTVHRLTLIREGGGWRIAAVAARSG
jgi:hypothetical protein